MKTRKTAVAIIAAVALAASACSSAPSDGGNQPVEGSWDDIISAAEEEGSVTLYGGNSTHSLDQIKKGFEQQYPGIIVNVVRGTDSDIEPKIDAEHNTGKGIGDVYLSGNARWIQTIGTKEYGTELRGPAFDDPEYLPDKSIVDERFFVANAIVYAIGWNTNRLPRGLKDIPDLLNPELAGQIAVINPNAGVATTEYAMAIDDFYGKELLDKMADLSPRVYPSSLPVAQALASGEVAAALQVAPLVPEQNAGAPVDWTIPSINWGFQFIGLTLASAPHPNAAQLLANYIVTREGQAALNDRATAAALPDISGALEIRAQDVPPAKDLSRDEIDSYRQGWEKNFLN